MPKRVPSIADAVLTLLTITPEQAALRDAQAGLRAALRDPTLLLGRWDAVREELVDADGSPFAPPAELAQTQIGYEGRPVGAIAHDPELLEDPELMPTIAVVARMGLEKDRVQAELRARVEELESERNFVETVVNSSPAYFCVLYPDGGIERYNETLAEATGHTVLAPVKAKPFWDVFVEEQDRDAVREAIDARTTEGHEHHWCNGRIVAWRLTPLPAPRDHLLITGLDITQRKRHEEDLRRSRARIVEAGDAARKRLERNLHDGAQQRLVSLSLWLRIAQSKLPDDPAAALEVMATATSELAQALDELRELARGLHPALLADRGLAPALHALCARSPLDVQFHNALGERLEERVEAALYYVCAEALTNVAKYANATQVHVRVGRVDGIVAVEIEDDGIGGANADGGSGLRGLADRVEALDGTLQVLSAAGHGTIVRAEIPTVAARVPVDA